MHKIKREIELAINRLYLRDISFRNKKKQIRE